ncbi:4Fe-4S dicluster domain-containing protein [Candidatus Bathyarchaeota archaeon]|nr:4Fe-4S dicluster domain-containing protein [Candidatus Bathyarchaeota archaeon]
MRQETYHGVPRSKIPWGPSINYEKCSSCGKCVDYCKLGVYEFEGKKRPVVRNPKNCIVFCTGCQEQCPVGAITFPSKKGTREIINKLRKGATYPF